MTEFVSKHRKEIICSMFSFILGVLVGVFLLSNSVELDSLVSPLATLVAAYFGVKYAFQLQIQERLKEETRKMVREGNNAIFELIRTYNKFVAIQKDDIKKYRKHPLKHYLIKASCGQDTHRTRFNFESLNFIYETEKPDFLNKLSMYELEANSTIDYINERSRIHFDRIQPAIEKIASDIDQKVSAEEIDRAVGVRNADLIVKMTDDIIDVTPKYIKELNEILRRKFTGHRILRMDIPNKLKI